MKIIKQNIDLSNLYLTTLPDWLAEVDIVIGDFDCSDNKLTNLINGPKKVKRRYLCNNNKLTSLDGCPEEIIEKFDCSDNQLTSLEGCPKYVEGDFICNSNLLTTLKYGPKEVNGIFWCRNNSAKFTVKEILEVTDVKGPIFC